MGDDAKKFDGTQNVDTRRSRAGSLKKNIICTSSKSKYLLDVALNTFQPNKLHICCSISMLSIIA